MLQSQEQKKTHLCHVLKINEVAEAEGRQVEAGLLAAVSILNGNGHFHVVGRPCTCIIFPLPLPALPRGRGGVVKSPPHRADGS